MESEKLLEQQTEMMRTLKRIRSVLLEIKAEIIEIKNAKQGN